MNSFDFVNYHRQIREELSGSLAGSDSELCQVMNIRLAQVEQILAENLTPQDHQRMACKAGCGSCCMVNVSVLLPEVLNISNYIVENYSAEQLTLLLKKMAKLITIIGDLEDDERIAVRKSCVFLNTQGMCDIYPVRPLLCRALTSTSAQDCKDALAMQALGEEIPVMMNLFQKNLFDVAYQGLATALGDAGLDDRGRELTGAVLQQLQKLP